MDTTSNALVVVGVGAVAAAAASWRTCAERVECEHDKKCFGVNPYNLPLICSFSTRVSLLGAVEYSGHSSNTSLARATRGVCAPGERMVLAADGASLATCAPFYPFPSALQTELVDWEAESWHGTWCGRWVGTGFITTAPVYWSFRDEELAMRGIVDATRAASRVPTDVVGKVRHACERTVLGGVQALRAAAVHGYRHLVAELDLNRPQGAWSSEGALSALGALAGHHCDAPVGAHAAGTSDGYVARLADGAQFDSGVFRASLTLAGAEGAWGERAEAANWMLHDRLTKVRRVTRDEAAAFVRGAAGADYFAEIDLFHAPRAYGDSDALDSFAELAREDRPYAVGLLHGVAAYCSFGMGTMFSSRLSSNIDAAVRAANARRPRAVGLNRLSKRSTEPMEEPDAAFVSNASVVTLQQLAGAPEGDAARDCARFVEGIFPDHFDAAYFELVVPPDLYARMEGVVRTVRYVLADAVKRDPLLRGALADPDRMAADVVEARVSIPGAPRGSWAAPDRAIVEPTLAADDGVFVMALKQSRALFLDRMDLVRTATSLCDGPSVYHPLYVNAYVQPSAKCVHMLLGMARRPWADAEYDEISLLSRWGYIVAHELAHLSLNSGYTEGVEAGLLRDYETGTPDESMADALAILSLMHHPTLNATEDGAAELCAHLSQSWCARVPALYEFWPLGSHPRANARGDSGCKTLASAGYVVTP